MRGVIRRITIAELREQSPELLRAHWLEVAKRRDLMVLDPDWPRYEAMEAAGSLLCLGAFVDGAMVGYSVSIVSPHLHYAGLVTAQNDVLFVSEPHRKSRIGLGLIRATEQEAKERGARLVSWHAKEATALHELLPALGYGVHETIFAREV